MSNCRFTLRRMRAVIALLLVTGAPALFARDAFVMLSGGHSPFDNNYSQYLQAKAVVTYFEQNYPPDSIWVFFGAGNVNGDEPIFCDVRREVKRDGLTMDSWLPGVLGHNRPARRDAILRTLREEILPTVADGGTLYLFVGDHGSQTRGTNAESIIDLWTLDRDAKSERNWRSTSNEVLSVTELRRTLAKGLGKGRVVFCMTQCHSGGFHHLAVPREMTANPKWFTTPPSWALLKKEQPTFVRAAGFTATDERSLAAGCQADPDPDRWAGYERFIPERLLGMNLFTLERAGKGLHSFAEAHIAATLVDQTIDKPYSTSEQYLERWASLIETRLAKETNLSSQVQKAVAAYQRVIDGAAPKEWNPTFRERQKTFRRFTETLEQQNPSLTNLLRTGTRKDLEQAIGTARGRNSGQTNRPPRTQSTNQPSSTRRAETNAPSETIKHWNVVRPLWTAAVKATEVTAMPAGAVEFEKFLLAQEMKGRDYFSSTSRALLREEAFWRSGYNNPQTLEPSKAEAVIRWGMERRAKIIAWAKTSEDEAVREAGEKLFARTPRRTNAPPLLTPAPQPAATTQTNAPSGRVSKKIAAERALFYRRVLGAWEFLLAVNERPALARVRELTELERTPLPRSEK